MAGHLAVGVVADERAIGDRAVEALLGGRHPRVEPLGDLLDPPVQRLEGRLQAAGVGHEIVAAAAAEHHRLPARSRRSLTASTMAKISATSARPPAASATMPAGSVRSFTTREVYERRQPRSNSAGYSERLLSVFVSPGTLATTP